MLLLSLLRNNILGNLEMKINLEIQEREILMIMKLLEIMLLSILVKVTLVRRT